jgi:hypothetical protein
MLVGDVGLRTGVATAHGSCQIKSPALSPPLILSAELDRAMAVCGP